MQTHSDDDFLREHGKRTREEFLSTLKKRADAAVKSKASQITAGKEGEEAIEEWQRHGVHVRHLPNDEQGILRISIGGGETPVPLNYLVFRGNHSACVDLLRQALRALQDGPK